MRGAGRGRAVLVFLLMVALGEFVAFGLVSKTITYRRGTGWAIALNWEGFILLSAVGVVFAGWCAYRTWRDRVRAATPPGAR
jgi:hypothetical protein